MGGSVFEGKGEQISDLGVVFPSAMQDEELQWLAGRVFPGVHRNVPQGSSSRRPVFFGSH